MEMGLGGISSVLAQTSSLAADSRTDSLKNSLEGDLSSASEEELMDVCKDFEAYFVEQVLKEVEKTIPEDEDEDSSMTQMKDYYKDQMIQSLAEEICDQQELGLAQQLYEQMKRNYSL